MRYQGRAPLETRRLIRVFISLGRAIDWHVSFAERIALNNASSEVRLLLVKGCSDPRFDSPHSQKWYDVVEIYWRPCLMQFENVNWTHLVQASGNLVLQKTPIQDQDRQLSHQSSLNHPEIIASSNFEITGKPRLLFCFGPNRFFVFGTNEARAAIGLSATCQKKAKNKSSSYFLLKKIASANYLKN